VVSVTDPYCRILGFRDRKWTNKDTEMMVLICFNTVDNFRLRKLALVTNKLDMEAQENDSEYSFEVERGLCLNRERKMKSNGNTESNIRLRQ
jgi:hypothetical protein